ncbi:MAG: nitroreductase family protein [Pseudomonadota bacterium]
MAISSDHVQFRYGDALDPGPLAATSDLVASMVARGSCRAFSDRAVARGLSELLCAAALAAPTKSDLQQRDIVVLRDPEVKARFVALVGPDNWVADAPHFAVFCGNHRRQRMLHKLRGHAFANDHLDAFFNATVDAAIALSAFVSAAEALGLGCCPISAVRNDAAGVSDLLALPDHVFPVAGLAYGYPLDPTPRISMRLPLAATVHEDRYAETGQAEAIAQYDARRTAAQPYAQQRDTGRFGTAEAYGWSEDKSRQYATPERQTFGAFVRGKGFNLS